MAAWQLQDARNRFSTMSAVSGLNRSFVHMNHGLIPDRIVMEAFNGYSITMAERCHGLEEESGVLAAQREVLLPGWVGGEVVASTIYTEGEPCNGTYST